ncbi:MAG: hypothetical protein P4L52_07240 [Acidocella sp.]|nr:hypothetical protein [Acidocella sp.]MDR3683585.1 hypothetical protein [Geothrix sp.]
MFRRRGLLAGVGAAMVLPRLARADDLGTACVRAVLGQMAALGDGPVLLNSYLVQAGSAGGDFDLTQANAAYVYDNALAGLLLLAAGHTDEAKRIATALQIAQEHDRKFADGRLRNCYQAGVMAQPAKLAGFWEAKSQRWDEDPYQVGTDSGPLAWAMLLWAALGMTTPANRAGNFLDQQLRAPSGYYGGLYGYDPAQIQLTWCSTEQNVDLAAAFRALGRKEDSAHAAAFVRSMFNLTTGRFDSGTGADGAVDHLDAADAGIWPYLAGLGSETSALNAIGSLQRGPGIGFSDASDGIWLEGTAFAALALQQMGHDSYAQSFLATVAQNTSPEGYVYATISPSLATGLTVGPSLRQGVPAQIFAYYRRPALSATCWAGLAALGVNPLAAAK